MTDMMSYASQIETHADRGWGRVRSRLREPTKEELQALKDRDVAEFLNAVAWTNGPSFDPSENGHQSSNSTPRSHEHRDSRPRYSSSDRSLHRSKQALRVDFTHAPPEIIGEGGDESKEPATTVSRARVRKDPIAIETAQKSHRHERNYSTDVSSSSKTSPKSSSKSTSKSSSSSASRSSPKTSPKSSSLSSSSLSSHAKSSHSRSSSSSKPKQANDDSCAPNTVPIGLRLRKHSLPAPRHYDSDEEEPEQDNSAAEENEFAMPIQAAPEFRRMRADLATNRPRASSVDLGELTDRSSYRSAMSSRGPRHNSADSVSSVEGYILGSTSPRLTPKISDPPLRKRANSSTMLPIRLNGSARPKPATYNSFDVTATTRSLQHPVPQSPRIVCLLSSAQHNSPLCRQYSWTSDVSEALLESAAEESTTQNSVEDSDASEEEEKESEEEEEEDAEIDDDPPPKPLPIPARNPERCSNYTIPPLKFERPIPDADKILQTHLAKKHLIPPQFERRPSAPNLSRGQAFAELAAPPKFERRPSAPFLDRGAPMSDMNHPAFRRPSMDHVPQIQARPNPGSRRGSTVQMQRTASHTPQQPSNLSVAHTQGLTQDFLAAYSAPPTANRVPEQHTSRPAPPPRTESYLDAKNAALAEFVQRTAHMAGIVKIAALSIPVNQLSTAKWLQLATFWLLKGRAGLNIYFSTLQRDDNDDEDDDMSTGQAGAVLTQHHLNIFKTWWIISEVLEHRLSATDSPEFMHAPEHYRVGVFQLTDALVETFKTLTLTAVENNLLPANPVLVLGLDTSLWLQDAAFPEDLRMLRRMLC